MRAFLAFSGMQWSGLDRRMGSGVVVAGLPTWFFVCSLQLGKPRKTNFHLAVTPD